MWCPSLWYSTCCEVRTNTSPGEYDTSVHGIPILAYHQITREGLCKNPSPLAVSVEKFERQMRYLHDHGYCCVSLAQVVPSPGRQLSLPRKAFALTFDDGYADFLAQAYPILRHYSFTATVFLVTDHIGGWSDWEGEGGNCLMTWEQVKLLQGLGISFGSHCCTHRRLSRLSGDEIWRELATSKERLESVLGQEAQWLAYPHGDSNPAIQAMAARIGYKAACGVSKGRSGPFNLWRYMVRADDSTTTFAFQVAGWYRLWNWFREETAAGQLLRQVKRRL